MKTPVEIAGVEILTLQSVPAVGRISNKECAGGNHLEGGQVRRQVASTCVEHTRGGEFLPDAFERRDRSGGNAGVVSQKYIHVVGVWADHSNGLERFTQRENTAFILEQYDRFPRGFQCQFTMGGTVVFAIRNLSVLHHF